MLEITTIEKQERLYLGLQRHNPLRVVFNVTAKCTRDEHRTGDCLGIGTEFVESVEAGKEYTFLVEVFNRFKSPIKVGDDLSLNDLYKERKMRVLQSNTKYKFGDDF